MILASHQPNLLEVEFQLASLSIHRSPYIPDIDLTILGFVQSYLFFVKAAKNWKSEMIVIILLDLNVGKKIDENFNVKIHTG